MGGGGANTLHSLDKSPKNTLYSYKSAKPTKQLFHATIARGFNESPKQSSLSIIARFSNAKSKKSAQFAIARALPEAIQKIKSFCYFWLLPKVESLYPTVSNIQSEIPPIHFWLIYFNHCLKSFALDTSLRNATLSMTKKFGLLRRLQRLAMTNLCVPRRHCEKIRRIFVAIHFSDFRIAIDSLTLGESMRLRFTRFVRFRLPCLDMQGLANTRNIRLCERML